MITSKAICAVWFVVAITFSTTFGVNTAAAGPAQTMIESIARAAEPIVNDRALPGPARTTKLRGVLSGALNRDQMAQSLMGRYWRRADAEQKTALADLLERYLIFVYASRVESIEGQVSFNVDGERVVGSRTLVDTRVMRPSQPAISVSWQVEAVDGANSITDIVVEGVSLIVSQRADFASVIRNQGGIDGLIDLLRKKLNN